MTRQNKPHPRHAANHWPETTHYVEEPRINYPSQKHLENTPRIRLLEQCIIQTCNITAVVRVFGEDPAA